MATSKLNILTRDKLPKLDAVATEAYLFKVLKFVKNKKLIMARSAPISFLYRGVQAYTPQGRVNVRIPLSKFKVSFKLGMFAATKKPFNFRPKIKKQKR